MEGGAARRRLRPAEAPRAWRCSAQPAGPATPQQARSPTQSTNPQHTILVMRYVPAGSRTATPCRPSFWKPLPWSCGGTPGGQADRSSDRQRRRAASPRCRQARRSCAAPGLQAARSAAGSRCSAASGCTAWWSIQRPPWQQHPARPVVGGQEGEQVGRWQRGACKAGTRAGRAEHAPTAAPQASRAPLPPPPPTWIAAVSSATPSPFAP